MFLHTQLIVGELEDVKIETASPQSKGKDSLPLSVLKKFLTFLASSYPFQRVALFTLILLTNILILQNISTAQKGN
jgi:hypothetical protein